MNHREADSDAQKANRGSAPVTIIVLLVIAGLIFLAFLPLFLSGLEDLTFGTNRVEDLCTRMGIHDELSALYEPVLRLLK